MNEFYLLLEKVYKWWPSVIEREHFLKDGARFYEDSISAQAEASGSRLLIQLDYIVYDTVRSAFKAMEVVRVNEIRRDYIEEIFHKLLLGPGVRQLDGIEENDGSFDLEELTAYLKAMGFR